MQDSGLTKSFIFAGCMFLAPILGTLAAGQANRLSIGTQIMVRAELTASIYRKALRLRWAWGRGAWGPARCRVPRCAEECGWLAGRMARSAGAQRREPAHPHAVATMPHAHTHTHAPPPPPPPPPPRSTRAKQQTETGRIVNHMSADVNQLMTFFYPFAAQLISGPAILTAAIVLLWFQIK